MLLIGERGRFLQTTWRFARGFAMPLAITVDVDVKRAKLMVLCFEWTVEWGDRKKALEYLDAVGDKFRPKRIPEGEYDEYDEDDEDDETEEDEDD